MRQPVHLHDVFLLLVTVVLLMTAGGCASTREARLFILPADSVDGQLDQDAARTRFSVRLLPVRLPDYLDRPQLVTRLSRYEVRGSEFNRWSMPLDRGVARFLSARLGTELPEAYVQAGTGTSAGQPMQYNLQVELMTMDGELGGNIDLVAEWTLFDAGSRSAPLVRRMQLYRQTAKGSDYGDYVEALAEALGRLAADLADAVREQVSG